MSEKPIFLFITIFILALALAFFSSYFIVQEVRGVDLGNNIDMATNRVYDFAPPTNAGSLEAVSRLYFDSITERRLQEGGSWYAIDNLCDLNDFSWCGGSQDDFPPDDPPGGEPECFAAKTLILMADNTYKPIEDVKQGDWVLTKENEKSDKMVSAKVSKTFEHTVDSYLIINNELKVTSNHPIFVGGKNNTWKQAWTIKLGNKLLNEKGEEVIVESLEFKRETIKVYNLEIEGFETYFSGGFYVHNKPLPV